jgi:ankyrin repeat protein
MNLLEIIGWIKTGQNGELAQALKANPLIAEGKTEQGISLLLLATYHRNKIAIELLRSYRQHLDIFEAASIGDMINLEMQLANDINLLNAYSIDGFTPLGLACFFGQYDAVSFLLAQGANPNLASVNAFRVAPIHSACAISNYDITELLIRYSANINVKQQQGITPLHSAAHHGQTRIVQLLITHGADTNAQTDAGQTPLDMALEKNFLETAAIIRQDI